MKGKDQVPPRLVRVHCGAAHVSGRARRYKYVVASLFVPKKRKADGHWVYVNSGVSTQPRRSRVACDRDAQQLADDHDAVLMGGYGSLHNQEPL